jgi:hypothetical protein
MEGRFDMQRSLLALALCLGALLASTVPSRAAAPIGDSFTYIVPSENLGVNEASSSFLYLTNPNPRCDGTGDAIYSVVIEVMDSNGMICPTLAINDYIVTSTKDCGLTGCMFGLCPTPMVLPERQTHEIFIPRPTLFGTLHRVTISYVIDGGGVNLPGPGTNPIGGVNHLQAEVAFSHGSQQGWEEIRALTRDSQR